MKTEQEQIKAIKQIIDERVETTLGQVQGRHGNVIKTVDTVIIARDIIEAGYGEVSEYKAEIERLRQEVRDTDKMARNTIEQYKNNYDNAFERLKAQEREIERLKADYAKLQTNAEILARGVRDLNHENYELTEKVKQAQIDVLNKVKDVLDNAPNGWAYTTYIDELIKEVENDK